MSPFNASIVQPRRGPPGGATALVVSAACERHERGFGKGYSRVSDSGDLSGGGHRGGRPGRHALRYPFRQALRLGLPPRIPDTLSVDITP